MIVTAYEHINIIYNVQYNVSSYAPHRAQTTKLISTQYMRYLWFVLIAACCLDILMKNPM